MTVSVSRKHKDSYLLSPYYFPVILLNNVFSLCVCVLVCVDMCMCLWRLEIRSLLFNLFFKAGSHNEPGDDQFD